MEPHPRADRIAHPNGMITAHARPRGDSCSALPTMQDYGLPSGVDVDYEASYPNRDILHLKA